MPTYKAAPGTGETSGGSPKGAKDKDREKWEADIYRVLLSRLNRSEKVMRPWIERGKALESFIANMTGNPDVENLLSVGNNWIRAKVNKMKPLAQGILSNVAFKAPQVVALPLRRSAEFVNIANVEGTYANRCLEEARFDRQQRMAAQDIILYGAGFIEEGTDPAKENIPTARHRRVADVRVDTQAQTPEEQTWVAFRQIMSLEKAKRVYDYEKLTESSDAMHDGTSDGSGTDSGRDGVKTDFGEIEPEDKKVTLWRFYLLKESLDFAAELTAKYGKGSSGDESPLEKLLEEEGNRVVVISEDCPGKILSNQPWPFFLDKDHLPYTILTFEDCPGRLLPESPLTTVRDQQLTLNNVYTFLVTQAFTLSKIKFVGDKGQIANDAGVMEKINSPIVGDVIGVEGGHVMLKALELGQLNTSMIQLFNMTNQLFDEISGFREMFGGMEGARSATEAGIREGRAQTLSSDNRQIFERGIREVLRKMMQIAYSTSKKELVAKYVGREELGFMPKDAEAQGQDAGKLSPKQTIARYWNEDMTPEEIRRENNVMLVPGSTKRVNTDKETQDLSTSMVMVRDLMMLYQQNGYRIAPEVLSRKLNYALSRILRSVGMYDYKQFEITAQDLNLEPALLGNDMSAGVQAKMAQAEGEKAGREAAGELSEEKDAANAEAISAWFQAQGEEENVANTRVAKMTPQQRALLVEVIEQGGVPGEGTQAPPV
ncbi:MAG: hypothetical protein IPL86_16960 [Flavobacteriales bacterium]|nr:hypothetical protein [Flavobacteriales bacterium]